MSQSALAMRAEVGAAQDTHAGESFPWREILPSSLTSMVFHIALLLVLAMWILPEPDNHAQNSLLVLPTEEAISEIEPHPTDRNNGIVLPTLPDLREPSMPTPSESVQEPFEPHIAPDPLGGKQSAELAHAAIGLPKLTEAIPLEHGLFPRGACAFANREPSRRRLRGPAGEIPASRDAVEAALRWLSKHQNADGSWSYNHREGGKCDCRNPGQDHGKFGSTALALLAFLGAGETHETGKYRRTIDRGLAFLVKNMDENEAKTVGKMLDAGSAGMYAHGLAAMALAEAYGMTHDSRLRDPAQAALNWIVESQAAGGFWGYTGGGNDTSVSGWQVMALKSGYAAGLSVPNTTIDGIRKGLDSVAGGSGAYYGYRGPVESFRPATTAIGLLSRIYTGWPNDQPALRRGMAAVLAKGPDFDDMYYTYYATQAMYQYTSGQGAAWQRYNAAMRDGLIATQARAGHETGSWNHCRYNNSGGRIYSTALAAMCLEIYYRYEPVYQQTRSFGGTKPKGKNGFAGSKPTKAIDEDAAWDLE